MTACRILLIGTIVFFVSQIAAAPADQGEQAAAPPAGQGAPNIVLTKKCPNMRYVGRDATFELGVTNRGTGAALNVVVTDTLPAGVEFLSADNDGKRDGQNVVWRLGNLDPGQSRDLKITVRCNQITTVRNTARVTYCAEAQAACEFPVKGVAAILLEMVDDPDPIEIGSTTTYTIVVTNQGTVDDTNIVITAIIPAEEDYVSSDGPDQGGHRWQDSDFRGAVQAGAQSQGHLESRREGQQGGGRTLQGDSEERYDWRCAGREDRKHAYLLMLSAAGDKGGSGAT